MFKVGAKVRWKWLGRPIDGTVEEVHFGPVTKLIKGKSIKRNGSKDKPAFLVRSEAGNLALKLLSELTKAPAKRKGPSPKMFSD